MSVTFTVEETVALGLELHQAGRLAMAEAVYDRLLACDPENADARHYLGVLALQVNKSELALKLIGEALERRPDDPVMLSHQGAAFNQLSRHGDAESVCRRAIALAPSMGVGYINLGNALKGQARLVEAREVYAKALDLEPNHAGCLANYAVVLRCLGDREGWWNAIARAATLDPNDADAKLLLAESLLERGDFINGFRLYECRYDLPRTRFLKRSFVQPQWLGEDIAGRTILVHDEQGFGDTLQFIRFLPLVKARGAKVIFAVTPELHGIASRAKGWDVLIRHGDACPPFDVQCPLMSLPLALGTTVETIPAEVPYLSPHPGLSKKWGKRVRAAAKDRLAVGLVWAGRADFVAECWRSPRLAPLLPLLDVPGVCVFALQKGDGRADLDGFSAANFVDLGADIRSFEDTAAVMANLDLVISSCTGPAHLAGALGRPLWMMLSAAADWRWLLDRADTPWYPTARLFRQPILNDWAPMVGKLHDVLRRAVAERVVDAPCA